MAGRKAGAWGFLEKEPVEKEGAEAEHLGRGVDSLAAEAGPGSRPPASPAASPPPPGSGGPRAQPPNAPLFRSPCHFLC